MSLTCDECGWMLKDHGEKTSSFGDRTCPVGPKLPGHPKNGGPTDAEILRGKDLEVQILAAENRNLEEKAASLRAQVEELKRRFEEAEASARRGDIFVFEGRFYYPQTRIADLEKDVARLEPIKEALRAAKKGALPFVFEGAQWVSVDSDLGELRVEVNELRVEKLRLQERVRALVRSSSSTVTWTGRDEILFDGKKWVEKR